MDTYYNSIGHNGSLLLNFPIMPNGLIHPTDEKMALEFGKAVKESFAVNLVGKAKAEASNVRGNAKRFGAAKAIDGNKDTYWATDDRYNKRFIDHRFWQTNPFQPFYGAGIYPFGATCKSLYG